MDYSETTLLLWASTRLSFSLLSISFLTKYLFENIKLDKDLFKILFIQLLLSRLLANILYFISAFSYIISREPTKTCPTVAILDIMNDYITVALTLVIAFSAGRKKFRDFVTQFRFCWDARNDDDDIQRIRRNAWIFGGIVFLVMAIFEIIVYVNYQDLEGLDFKCYLKTGTFSIISQYLGFFLIILAFLSQWCFQTQNDYDRKNFLPILNVNAGLALFTVPFCIRDLLRNFFYNEIADSIFATLGYVFVSSAGFVFVVIFKRIFKNFRMEDNKIALLNINGSMSLVNKENESTKEIKIPPKLNELEQNN